MARGVQFGLRVFDEHSVLRDDAAFDDRLPQILQVRSSTFFTPIDVAARAARLLAPSPGMTVLDVGSGAGKFCIAAALAVPTCEFVGVEWRRHLVELSNALVRDLGVRNARFIHGDALDLDWSAFDSFYFFNPFAEQLFDDALQLDRTIELDPANFIRCVSGARQRLARARLGTRVVTYHGFGAPPPFGYERARTPPSSYKRLELWLKVRSLVADTNEELIA